MNLMLLASASNAVNINLMLDLIVMQRDNNNK